MVIVVIGVVIYYWQWTHSPVYALLQAKKAVEKHDLETFERYVDVQTLTERLIDQILEFNTLQEKQSKNEWERMGENFAKGFIHLLKPQLVKLAQAQIAYYIEKGSFETQKDETETETETSNFSLKEIWDKSGGGKSKFCGFEYVKKDGKIAIVGLCFLYEEYNMKLVLDVKMRKKMDIGRLLN